MSRQAFLYQAKCERRSSMPAFTFMLEIAVFVGFGVVVVSDPDFSVVVRIVTTSDFENRLSSQVSHALSVRVVLDFILVRFYVADA